VKIVDRYLSRKLLVPLVLVFCAFVVIFILVDLFDHAHSFIDRGVPARIVLLYYLYSTPLIVVLTAPVAMLLAVLLSVGRLSRRLEIMALKASGFSLHRILAPVLVIATLLSAATLLVAEFAVPPATRQKIKIEEEYIDRREGDPRIRDNVVYMRADGSVFVARRLDVRRAVIDGVIVEEFDSQLRPLRRIDAAKATWNGSRWVLADGRIRSFTATGEDTVPFDEMTLPHEEPTLQDLGTRRLDPQEMGSLELRDYTRRLLAGGNDVRELLVELRLKIAFPFSSLIMALLGAPFAAATRRSGFALAFAAALTISFLYYGFIQVGQVLGRQGLLTPALAAWVANAVFAAVGVVLLARAPK